MSENLSAFKRNSLKGEETITLYSFQSHRKYITPRKYAKNSPLYMQKFVVCQEHLKWLLVDFPQPLKMNLTAISCTFDNISDHNSFNTTHWIDWHTVLSALRVEIDSRKFHTTRNQLTKRVNFRRKFLIAGLLEFPKNEFEHISTWSILRDLF